MSQRLLTTLTAKMAKHRRPDDNEDRRLRTVLIVTLIVLGIAWLALVVGRVHAATGTAAFATGPTKLTQRASRAAVRQQILPAKPVPKGLYVAQQALRQVGKPYVWGSKGPNAFDCSGLTRWAWQQAGIQIGLDTYSQVTQGISVPPSQVQPGDLIFPQGSFNNRGPGHVQLAISATQVVEAPGKGMAVRVIPMPNSYVAKRIQ